MHRCMEAGEREPRRCPAQVVLPPPAPFGTAPPPYPCNGTCNGTVPSVCRAPCPMPHASTSTSALGGVYPALAPHGSRVSAVRLSLTSSMRGNPWAPKALFGPGRQAQSPKPNPTRERGEGEGKGSREGRIGQGGRGRALGGERSMGTTAYGGKGSKGRAANGDRPVGAASCRREQYTMATCPPPPPARTSQCWSRQTQHGFGVCIWMHLVNGTGNRQSSGQPIPGVVKQDKSSRGSVDTTKTTQYRFLVPTPPPPLSGSLGRSASLGRPGSSGRSGGGPSQETSYRHPAKR